MLGLGLGRNKRGMSGVAFPFVDDYSIYLDGVNEYVNIDNLQASISASTIGTFSFWVKPVDATPSSTQVLLGFGDTDAQEDIQVSISPTGLFQVFVRDSGVAQWFLVTDSTVFSDGVWTHLAVVQDGVSPVIYVNGVAVPQTFNTSTDKTSWFNDLTTIDNGRIGCLNFNSGGNTAFFNGNIDEFLYTLDAKSSVEISAIYNSGTPKDERGISNGISYYLMGDNPGDNWNVDNANEWTFKDTIGNNNAVTVNCEEADVELDTP